MDHTVLQLARLVHIVAAAFWVGAATTLGFFVYPALLTADIGATRLVRQIMITRRLAIFVMLSALLAVISGAYLYWGDFGTMPSGPLTRRALDNAIGGFLGVLALGTAIFVNMPTGMKMGAVVDSIGTGNPPADQANELARLSRKLIIATRSVSILALGAAAFMALARNAQ
jgi:hypothetical protein